MPAIVVAPTQQAAEAQLLQLRAMLGARRLRRAAARSALCEDSSVDDELRRSHGKNPPLVRRCGAVYGLRASLALLRGPS